MTAFLGHMPKTDAAKLAAQLDSIADEELSDDFPGSASIVRQAAEMLRASIPVDVERGTWTAVGFVNSTGDVIWEPNKGPGDLIPGQLIYVSHTNSPEPSA